LAIACTSCQRPQGGLPCIDVRKNYPVKEVLLTDIADVTYLYLNSNADEYLYSGNICAVTENTIVVAEGGYRSRGNVFFFDRNGQPKSRFNRKGNGPQEYRNLHKVLYDEMADDVFIASHLDTLIRVYSSTGMHKRDITLPSRAKMGNELVSFDDSSLIFYDVSKEINRFDIDYKNLSTNDLTSRFFLISKSDGAVLDSLELPIAPIFLGIYHKEMRVSAIGKRLLIESTQGVLICNPENDTVFLYGKDKSLSPVLHKTPLADATDPMTYLNNCVDMGNYQFMEVYTVRAGDVFPGVFPVKYYMRDKGTGEIFQQKLLLPDYLGKEFVIGPFSGIRFEEGVVFELDLLELKEAYAENKLSGKLKELVATLKADDNNVFVIAEFKY